ncbi:MAG: 2-C-methyl-D-erythritol 4-phosphate cytidylyltransferase [Limnochordales bacterium]
MISEARRHYTAAVVIPAAGAGHRMGRLGQPKQFMPLLGDPVILWTLRACAAAPSVSELVLVVAEGDVAYVRARLGGEWQLPKPVTVTAGGASRQQSVYAGLRALAQPVDLVAVHDGVRPLMSPALLERTLAAACEHGAATAAVPLKDTVKLVESGWVQSTPPRARLRAVQTPQAFRRELLLAAHDRAAADGVEATDDAALVERLGQPVAVVEGEYSNIKITTPEDLLVAEALLRARIHGRALAEAAGKEPAERREATVRVGYGYDVHRLAAGRRLVIGGVEIPYERGLLGHSDADVLLHAIADALLGAAGLGDIGRHFPDSDPAYKDVASVKLLCHVRELVGAAGWRVGNVDATVIAEAPRLAPFIPRMIRCISEALGVDPSAVNVKATTSEKLGFIGAGEGIAAHAVATLYADGEPR